MGTVIKVENLTKTYIIDQFAKEKNNLRDIIASPYKFFNRQKKLQQEEFKALDDISFDVMQGDRVGIIGRNGAGKSTLLKILSRITEPSKGRISIKGRVASLLEVGTGFHPELSGRENIFLNGSILGMTKAEIRKNLDEIVSFSEIEKFIDTPVKRYSSGMYVRLAFAVAAHLEPEILIVDEVLAVGDSAFQKKCLGKMKSISGEGRTILFVSHDIQAITTLTENAIFIKSGKIEFHGPTAEATIHYIKSGKELENNIYIDKTPALKPKITKVNLVTSLPNNVQKNNDPFTIQVTIETPIPIKSACLSIQIQDAYERNYVHTWLDSDTPYCRTEGIYTLTCKIPKLKLFMGNYSLKLYLSEPPGGELFQILEKVCPFEVVMYEMSREFQWHPGACAYLEDSQWEVLKV